MRVLFVLSTFPAISETFILNQITGFLDQGHDVEIIAMSRTEGKAHSDVEKYGLLQKTMFVNIPKSKYKKMKRLMKHFFTSPLKSIKLLNFYHYGTFVFSLRPLFASELLKNQNQFDAIIAHYGSNGLLLSILEKESHTNRFVFFHGNDLTGFIKKFGSKIYASLFKSDIQLLPISNLWKKRLIAYGANPKKIQVHHMGIDLNKFIYTPPKRISSNVNSVLVGRLTEKKGIDIAINSIKLLLDEGIKVHLTIIGDGEDRERLINLTYELGVSNQVRFLGWCTQSELQEYISNADMILQPSRTAKTGDMEGIPVSLMEAMAKGKLVVSTFHSGIPELIYNNENGLLADENSHVEFAYRIKDILCMSNQEKESLSINARKSVAKSFNIQKLNEQLINMCSEKRD